MRPLTKDELAAMIASLESQPHLSLKEEKYLAVCRELLDYKRHDEEMEQLRAQYEDGRL